MRLITHIKASNLLSFGPDGLDLELHDLNVLIGPNGSGKSNFLEIFEILKALPRGDEDSNNLEQVISRGGGIEEWIMKIGKNSSFQIQAETTIEHFLLDEKSSVDHTLTCSKFQLIQEEKISPIGAGNKNPVSVSRLARGQIMFGPSSGTLENGTSFVSRGFSPLSTRASNRLLNDLAS
ncbi:MAG TPA: AAA family ATPase, partial [Saprospiraceae bacterium]|nr:AAA family ATPase [Saprospiraceae bacterium]